MTLIDSPFPLALRKRPRRRFTLFAALAILPVGMLPVLGIAQASRQAPGTVGTAAVELANPAPPRHVDRPATVSLGALIDVQRRAREQRIAMAAVEQRVAQLPPGEAWQAQLGAFGSADAAERQRTRLIEAGVHVLVRQAGSLHRLQSVPAMRTETEGLCARALASGIDCFVRPADTI